MISTLLEMLRRSPSCLTGCRQVVYLYPSGIIEDSHVWKCVGCGRKTLSKSSP